LFIQETFAGVHLDAKLYQRLSWKVSPEALNSLQKYYTTLQLQTNRLTSSYRNIDFDEWPHVAEGLHQYERLQESEVSGNEKCEQCIAA
jgi:hypothetical protein